MSDPGVDLIEFQGLDVLAVAALALDALAAAVVFAGFMLWFLPALCWRVVSVQVGQVLVEGFLKSSSADTDLN